MLSIIFSSLLYGPVLEIMYGILGSLGLVVVVCPRSLLLTSTPGVPLFLTGFPVVLPHILPLLPDMFFIIGWVSLWGIMLHNVLSCHNYSICYSFIISPLSFGS
jgi:hypothetical protein